MSDHRLLRAALRRDFPSFLRKSFGTVHPGTAFLPNWHIDAIAHRLELVKDGNLKRLIINQPPRSLKSITVSVAYVAWRLGIDPSLEIIVVSYSREFAADLHRLFRVLVESDWYRATFPATKWAKQTDTDFVTTQGGGRFATSIGGTLTGRGGDLLIIDDPMNATEAQSEPARKKVIDFYANSLVSRLNDKRTQAIILVMQRLHEADLAGYLLEQNGWDHLNLPAIATEDASVPIGYGRIHRRLTGEILHAAREDRGTLDRLKTEMGSLVFSSQYQQAPLPIEGNMVKRSWLQFYQELPETKGPSQIVQSWDVAAAIGNNNDWSVAVTARVTKSDVYITNVWRGRLMAPDLRKKVAELAITHKANVVLIEEAGLGLSLVQDLRQTPLGGMPRPIGVKPEGSKIDRLAIQSARFESGQVHLPRNAPWLDAYLLELLGFPGGRHDDQVDATSQLLAWWVNWSRWSTPMGGPIIITIPRYDQFDAPTHW